MGIKCARSSLRVELRTVDMSRPAQRKSKATPKGEAQFWQAVSSATARAEQQARARQGLTSTGRATVSFDETKYFDCGINTAVTWSGASWADSEVPCDNFVNSSGTAAAYTDSALVPSAVGSGYGQVNGNRYKLKKIRVRGNLSTAVRVDQADVQAPLMTRLLLVMDMQPNGAQAQGEDIIQDMGAGGENLFSFKRVASTSGRFRILKDHFVILQPGYTATDHATNSSTNSNVLYSENFSFQYQPKTPILCNIKSGNATPTVAGLVNCNIFMLLASNTSTSAVACTIVGSSRAYYVD